MTEQMLHAVLYALYALAQADRPADAGSIARAANVTTTQAAQALVELERCRLVDASRARLTMRGLAMAVSRSAKVAADQVQVRDAPRASTLPPRQPAPAHSRARPGKAERQPRSIDDTADPSQRRH